MNPQTPSPSSASLAADLRSAADRARDERLKLAAMVKQQNANVQLHGGPAPASQIAALSEKIQRLDDAIAQRLEKLDAVDQRIDERVAKLDDLQLAITQSSKAFADQVEKAQHFKHHVDAAKQHVRMSAGQIVEDVRLHLESFEGPIAERLAALNDLDEQMDKRVARMQQMHKQAGDAVDKHLLGALRAAKEQATAMVEPIKQELDTFLKERAVAMEEAVQSKIAALDIDVEDALRPVTSRFEQIVAQAQTQAAELADALPGELDARCETHVEKLRETLLAQVSALMQGWDEKAIREAAERYRQEVGNKLGSMFDEVEQEAEVFSEKLSDRFEDSREKAAARFDTVLDELEAGYDARAQKLLGSMQERIAEVIETAEQDARIVAARAADIAASSAHQALEQINERSAQVDEQAARINDRLAAITGCIKESGQQNREQIAEIESDAGERLDAVENATRTRLEDIQAASKARIEQIEHDASRLLIELTAMAESSGRRVSSSLATLSRLARDKADQAQAQIDNQAEAVQREAETGQVPRSDAA